MVTLALVVVIAYIILGARQVSQWIAGNQLSLLTDPFLQAPTADSVQVVWFTEFEGDRHRVEYGTDLENTALATTINLSRTREDQDSRVGEQVEEGQLYEQPVMRPIWRHEAVVTGLQGGDRLPYRVISQQEGRRAAQSETFSLAPAPQPGQPLKILLTSDHQQMPMTAANLQKMVETVGAVDAVFLAGDLVNVPDRASEWFDDNRGGAFFPVLQGHASYELDREGQKTVYRGGAVIQSAPLFPATGNHEVMGRWSTESVLWDQYNDPFPKAAAVKTYTSKAEELNPNSDPAVYDAWLRNNTYNTQTYEEIFSLPNDTGTETYYAVSFGDIRLISLYATNIWRVPFLGPDARGKYRERDEDLKNPERWGYGQHIFEPIQPGSEQYEWLKQELARPEFQQAKYKIVMFHHPVHSLGDNIVPAYTNPIQKIDLDPNGEIQAVRYEYPLEADYLVRDVAPLLESAGVQLVLYGHSHLWNRFVSPSGMHFLETSNVGNTYGAYVGSKRRPIPIGFDERYVPTGDPYGLEPVMPTIAPLTDDDGNPIPYISSNEITVFSILDTGTGVVSSYYFDTREPDSPVVKFDEFAIATP